MGFNIVVGLEIFYPQINGLVTTTMNLLKSFKELGHSPIIVTPQVTKHTTPMVEDIPIYYLPSTDAFTYPGLRLVNPKSSKFKNIIERHNADIIQTTAPWFVAKGLNNVGKKKNIPMINTFHTNLHDQGYLQYIAPFIHKYAINFLQKGAWHAYHKFLDPVDVIVAPSPHTCSDIEQNYPNKRIEWIPNGVYVDMFKKFGDFAYLESFIPDLVKHKKQYAIFVGRHATEKSIDVLLEATAIVVKTIPNFQLVLVGDGPKRNAYIKLAQKFGIAHNTNFLGNIAHADLIASGLIQKARFFTTASITETHSMTVTESLCCGTPVVVADDPSMTYLTETTGHYFKSKNATDMARAMIDMWEDDAIYIPRKKAATHMLKEFDGRKIAEQYINLYSELIEKRNCL